MSLFRTFIAVEVNADVRRRAAGLIKQLQRADAKVSWTQLDNLHLTLKFIGDVPDAKIPDVCRVVSRAAADAGPISVAFNGAGAFPKNDRPRTIWIGIDRGSAALIELQRDIEDQLMDLGFPRERRRYTPHLTIGRVRSGGPSQQALGEVLRQRADFSGGETTIDEVLVMASFLDSEGPTYQVLGRSPL